jgi:hypothetical protein
MPSACDEGKCRLAGWQLQGAGVRVLLTLNLELTKKYFFYMRYTGYHLEK